MCAELAWKIYPQIMLRASRSLTLEYNAAAMKLISLALFFGLGSAAAKATPADQAGA